MQPKDLITEQLTKLAEFVHQHASEVKRLRWRMNSVGWPLSHPVFRQTTRASEALDQRHRMILDMSKPPPEAPAEEMPQWRRAMGE